MVRDECAGPGGRLSDLGEGGILARILPLAPTGPATLLGIGDDAAVVAAADGRVVATTDMLVEGRDFRRDLSSGVDVGWKAAAQNLADVAAMGAAPTALLLALGAPPSTAVAWLEDVVRGLAACCAPHGVALVGGDLSGSDEVVLAVTALGDLAGRRPVRRDGARPGGVVAHAGVLGRSAAGLDLLLAGMEEASSPLVTAHRRPAPPVRAGLAASRAGATAMIDLSDGLVRDAGRVAEASGVHLDLDAVVAQALDPLLLDAARALGRASVGEAAVTAEEQALRWVLTGGEDHGLLAVFDPGAALPGGFRRLGEVVPVREGVPAVTVGGAAPGVPGGGGWDHFG